MTSLNCLANSVNRKLGSETDDSFMSLLAPAASTIEVSDMDIEKSLSQQPAISLSQSGRYHKQTQNIDSFSIDPSSIISNFHDNNPILSQIAQPKPSMSLTNHLPNKPSTATSTNKKNISSLKRLIDSSDDDSDQGGALSYMNY